MSSIKIIHGSCADQEADAVVNAANDGLWMCCCVLLRTRK